MGGGIVVMGGFVVGEGCFWWMDGRFVVGDGCLWLVRGVCGGWMGGLWLVSCCSGWVIKCDRWVNRM